MKPNGMIHAVLAAATEVAGGILLFAVGLLTPLAAAGVSSGCMLVAGVDATTGRTASSSSSTGWEYNLVLAIVRGVRRRGRARASTRSTGRSASTSPSAVHRLRHRPPVLGLRSGIGLLVACYRPPPPPADRRLASTRDRDERDPDGSCRGSRRARRRPGAGSAGPGHPPAAARVHRRDAAHDVVPRPQGRRHRPGGRHLAGDLLPVLPRRRGGDPRAGRGDGASRGEQFAELVRADQLEGQGRLRRRASALADEFIHFWEEHQPVLRVVDLATDEGDGRFANVRTHLLNDLNNALAEAISEIEGGRAATRRRRPDGHRRRARVDARPRRRPPLRLRVLGRPHRRSAHLDGPHRLLVGHRPEAPDVMPAVCPRGASCTACSCRSSRRARSTPSRGRPTAGADELAAVAQAADRAGFFYVARVRPRRHPARSRPRSMGTVVVGHRRHARLAGRHHRRDVRLLSHVVRARLPPPAAGRQGVRTLDDVSGGRAILGVGAGHVEGEFDLLGLDFADRGRCSTSRSTRVRAAFADEYPTVDGPDVAVRRTSASGPGRCRPAGPPIWVGGSSQAGRCAGPPSAATAGCRRARSRPSWSRRSAPSATERRAPRRVRHRRHRRRRSTSASRLGPRRPDAQPDRPRRSPTSCASTRRARRRPGAGPAPVALARRAASTRSSASAPRSSRSAARADATRPSSPTGRRRPLHAARRQGRHRLGHRPRAWAATSRWRSPAKGADVVLGGRTPSRLEAVAAEVEALGRRALPVRVRHHRRGGVPSRPSTRRPPSSAGSTSS